MSSVPVKDLLLHEPDYIAALLEVYRDRVPHRTLAAESESESRWGNKLARRVAPFLDTLAHLLVCEKKNQTIALSVLVYPPPEARLHFFVAQDSEPDSTQAGVSEHIRFIMAQLSKACTLAEKRADTSKLQLPSIINFDTSDDLEAELLKLEYGLIRYSWKEIHRRLVKNDRHVRFRTLANDILELPEPDRGALTPDEHEILAKIKGRIADNPLLRFAVENISNAIQRIDTILESPPSSDGTQVMLLRADLVLVSGLFDYIFSPLAQDFNEYTRRYLAAKKIEASKKDVDVIRWFAKIMYVNADLNKLIPLVQSSTFSRVRSATVEVECVPNEPKVEAQLAVTSDEIDYLFIKSGRHVSKVHMDAIRLLVEHKNTANSSYGERSNTDADPPAGKTLLSLRGHSVHSECVLLAHLDSFLVADPIRETELVPYIGTSRRPCALCDIYLAVYNSATNRNIRVAQRNGKTVAWRRPILGTDRSEEDVRATLHVRLVDMLWEKIQASEVVRAELCGA